MSVDSNENEVEEDDWISNGEYVILEFTPEKDFDSEQNECFEQLKFFKMIKKINNQ